MAQSAPYTRKLPDGLPLTQTITTVASAASPANVNINIPSNGIWIAGIEAYLDGNANYMAVTTVLLDLMRGANNVLSRYVLAAAAFSSPNPYGLSALTAGVPTTSNQFQISCSWTDGASHSCTFTVGMRLLMPLG